MSRHPSTFHCTAAQHRCARCGAPITPHPWRHRLRRGVTYDHQATHYLPGCPTSDWPTTPRDTAPAAVVA